MTDTRRISTVGDLMSRRVIVIQADATLTEAALLMDYHRISGLPVVDGSGALVGVLSQTDLARARVTMHLWSNWPGLAVRHLMTHPAVTAHRSTPLDLAAEQMERLRIHRLVVVDDRDETLPVGVLSLTDIVHAIAEGTDVPPFAEAVEASDG